MPAVDDAGEPPRWTVAGGTAASREALDDLSGRVEAIRRLLRADTAAFLVLEENQAALSVAASSGMDFAYRASTRVPFGRGFAGSIARTRRPIVLDEVGPDVVVNPLLPRRGLRSMAGVPVVVDDRLVGVLHVGSVVPRHFTAQDTSRLETAALGLGEAADRVRDSAEATAALALQHSLLPATLPAVPGLDLAARYLPAEGALGGDWYDVFKLPDGRVGVVIGDVAGHGLAAAIVMGRLRSALRAYALDHDDPAEVLHRLDRKVAVFEIGAFATITYAIADPPYGTLRLSSAGHLPPIVALPGSPPAVLRAPVDVPIGVDTSRPRRTTTLQLPVGGSLGLFTDGLVERRPRNGSDPADLDLALERVAAALPTGDAESACTEVVAAALDDGPPEDDVALLIVRRV